MVIQIVRKSFSQLQVWELELSKAQKEFKELFATHEMLCLFLVSHDLVFSIHFDGLTEQVSDLFF